jgi:hypothetical protein
VKSPELSWRGHRLVDGAVESQRLALKYRGSSVDGFRPRAFSHALKVAKLKRQALLAYASGVCRATPRQLDYLTRALARLVLVMNPANGPVAHQDNVDAAVAALKHHLATTEQAAGA